MKNLLLVSTAASISLLLVGCGTVNDTVGFANSTVGTGVKYTATTVGTGVGLVGTTGSTIGRGVGTVVGTGVGVVGTGVNAVGTTVGNTTGYVTKTMTNNGHRYVLKNGKYVRVN
ncbi:MAG: hypothetical protein LCH30_00880 [Proteobacteria bacterium]|nr:hypothetical protein [Pseudomonadota bacterium]